EHSVSWTEARATLRWCQRIVPAACDVIERVVAAAIGLSRTRAAATAQRHRNFRHSSVCASYLTGDAKRCRCDRRRSEVGGLITAKTVEGLTGRVEREPAERRRYGVVSTLDHVVE